MAARGESLRLFHYGEAAAPVKVVLFRRGVL